MSYVGRVIHDGDTESLIRKYLKAGVMNKGTYEATDVGTPQRKAYAIKTGLHTAR